MKQSEVLESLKGYISREILDGKDIGLDASTPLLEWGIINSLEMARLVSFIEDRFNVEVPADKILLEHFKDLTSLINLVSELAEGDPAEPHRT
jgi:acyl carrier protein